MALIICDKHLSECLPCDDDPLLNISAEEPDRDRFIANISYFGPYGPGPTGPRLGQTFLSAGCKAICFSTVSQDEADDCALRQAQECAWDTWRDPDGNPILFFGSHVQTCTQTCPDGTTFTWLQAAGSVFGLTQLEANSLAFSLACKRAQANKICISTSQLSFCLGQENQTKTLQANGGTAFVLNNINFGAVTINCDEPSTSFDVGDVIRYIWSIQSGSLPVGLDLDPCTGNITGTPTSAGSSTITVRATDAIGSFQQKSITINVIEILPQDPSLDDASAGMEYLVNFSTNIGDQEQQTWTIVDGTLPDGLTLTTAGVLSGTPTDIVETGYLFTVRVVDSGTGAICTKEYDLTVVTDTPLEYWDYDEASGTRIGSIHATEMTESGGVVSGVAGKISNAARIPLGGALLNTAIIAALRYQTGTSLSVSGWIRPQAGDASAMPFFTWSFFEAPFTQIASFSFEWASGTNLLTCTAINLSGGGSASLSVVQALTLGQFYFFHVYYDVNTGKVSIELDTVALGTSVSSVVLPASDLGRIIHLTPGTNVYDIDEVAFRNYLPSATEINGYWNGGAGHTYPL